MKVVTRSNLNVLNSIIRFPLSVLDQKDPFWANLFQALKTVYLFKMKFGTQIKLNMLNLMVTFIFSCFGLKIPFLSKFGQKVQIRLFKMNFSIQTDWNMLNSIVIFNISFCKQIFILDNLGSKNQNCVIKMKLWCLSQVNYATSMLMFVCTVLNWKYFWDGDDHFFCGGMNCMLIKKN